MNKGFLRLLVCILFFSNLSHANEIMLSIGSASDSFEEDSVLFASGSDVGGSVLILVNGNPVFFHRNGGTIRSISQWIVKGVNTISIRGKKVVK